MPCRFAFRLPGVEAAAVDTAERPAAGALKAYRKNRRTWLRALRSQTRFLVFLFACLEVIWRGPADIVSGKNYNPEIDHGFVYNIGYFFGWVFSCIFTVIWASLFEWWVPVPSAVPAGETAPPSKLACLSHMIAKFDMVVFPICIGITLATWGVLALLTVSNWRQTPLKYTSKFRSGLTILASVAWTTSFGYYSLETLSHYGLDGKSLARVRWEMDAWVLAPIAVNMGIAIGTGFVAKLERKRIARVEARDDAERAISVEEFLAEEKQPLIEA